MYDYERRTLVNLGLCIRALRRLNAELPIQAAHVFLSVATNPGLATPELMSRTGLAQSSCSRNVALLSERHRKGAPGLGLITVQPDPADYRRNILDLTDSGRELAKELVNILNRNGDQQKLRKRMQSLSRQSELVIRETDALKELAESIAVMTS